MHQSTQQPPSPELTRLKQIQKSNSHVTNLIQNAKKMIYSQVSDNQKEVLEIKISIEKDHLKRTFYKIDCPDQDFTVSIARKSFQKDQANQNTIEKQDSSLVNKPYSISEKLMIERQKFNSGKNQSTFHPSKLYQLPTQQQFYENQQPNQQPDTKITISRYMQQQQDQSKDQKDNQSVQIYQNLDQDQYEIDVSGNSSHDKVYIKPSKNRTVVVNTRTQSVDYKKEQKDLSRTYFAHKQKYPQQQDEYTPTFSSYRKQRQESLNNHASQSNHLNGPSAHHYEEEISIKTPHKQLQIISTETEQKLFMQTMNIGNNSSRKRSPKTQLITFSNIQQPKHDISSYESYRSKQKLKDSDEPSTSYKEILEKNKSRLQSSRQKLTSSQIPTTPQSKKSGHYQLHIDQLLRKKSQSKKRLYGPSYESSSKPVQSSLASTTKKYSISNSQKTGPKLMDSRRNLSNLLNKSREQYSGSRNFNSSSSLSQSKKNSLHSTTLKSYNAPCSTCSKCKSSFSSPKQSKEAFEQFYLAKKYLTEEGEQECYNFLRSQGIPQKDWPTFITEYIYRQLSKAYQQASPRQDKEA